MTEKLLLSEKVMFRLTEGEYQELVERARCQQRSLSNLVRIIVVHTLNEQKERGIHSRVYLTHTDNGR